MSSTPSSTPPTSSSTGNSMPPTHPQITKPNDTYVYGFGILAAIAIGACLFFVYNTFQPKNNKLINEKQDQPPKRRHML